MASHAAGWPSHEHDASRCGRFDETHIDIANAVVTAALDLTAAQQAALEPINAAADRWRGVAQQTCEQADFSNLDASLGTLENALGQTTQAVGELRPLLVDFYNGLDSDQQAKIHEFMQRHHGKRRHGRWGH